MNALYQVYCRENGNDEAAQLAIDEERWPGGKMCGYMLWCGEKWREWRTLKGFAQDRPLSETERNEFMKWVGAES